MASSKTYDLVTQREEARGGCAAASTSASIVVLASDRRRAELAGAGLGGVPYKIVFTSDPGWRPARGLSGPVSLIVIAAPEPDISVLAEILALPGSDAVPVVVFVDRSTREETMQALGLGVSAYIVDGLEPKRIPLIIDVAKERHAMVADLHAKLRKSQDDLAARKTIERAKGLIMSKSGLSEQEAYDSMRRLAMTQGKPLRELAETILSLFALFP